VNAKESDFKGRVIMTMRVLVGEPNPSMSEMVALFLLGAGYRVETAGDGLECLSKLRETQPERLVLSRDLLWGGADGVLACMRDDHTIPDVPVVLLISDGASEDLADLIRPPVVACLRRPFHLSNLLRHLLHPGTGRPEDVPAAVK